MVDSILIFNKIQNPSILWDLWDFTLFMLYLREYASVISSLFDISKTSRFRGVCGVWSILCCVSVSMSSIIFRRLTHSNPPNLVQLVHFGRFYVVFVYPQPPYSVQLVQFDRFYIVLIYPPKHCNYCNLTKNILDLRGVKNR